MYASMLIPDRERERATPVLYWLKLALVAGRGRAEVRSRTGGGGGECFSARAEVLTVRGVREGSFND